MAAMGLMDGRVCLVTGANSGIGKEIARGLACLGATVVLAVRNRERGEAARREIESSTGGRNVSVLTVDLASLSSVRTFAAGFAAKHQTLHVLVNNAGIYTHRRTLTEDGVESTFATNHLGPFLLTNLLLDKLKASAPARIVNVSSEANQSGRIAFDNLNGERSWSGFRAYTQSKLANILFAFELARRLDGTGVAANAMHPGGVRTNLMKGSPLRLGMLLAWPFLISPETGADTAVYVASSPEVEGTSGKYFIRRRPAAPNPIAEDPRIARRLWEVSEALSGLRTSEPAWDPS